MKLTSQEEKELWDLCLFISLIYASHWHEAPLAVRTPRNDLALLSSLESYQIELLPKLLLNDTCGTFLKSLLGFRSSTISWMPIKETKWQKTWRDRQNSGAQRYDSKLFSTANSLKSYVTERTGTLFSRNHQKREEKGWKPPVDALYRLDKKRKLQVPAEENHGDKDRQWPTRG